MNQQKDILNLSYLIISYLIIKLNSVKKTFKTPRAKVQVTSEVFNTTEILSASAVKKLAAEKVRLLKKRITS